MSPLKLIILARDGTINVGHKDYVQSVEEWEPLPGALEAIARLNHAGWHTVIATNQPGLGRGLFDMSTMNGIHARLNQMLARHGGRIDAVFFCPHARDEGCHCRKPMPGLFEQIGERFGVDLAEVPTVGDALADLQAGAAVGCPTHLVRTGASGPLDEAQLEAIVQQVPGTHVHADLAAFAEFLIQGARKERGDSGAFDSGFGRLD